MNNQLVLTKPDANKLLQAGFVLKTGRSTIYTHARYPGWLFKSVDDVESALSCGGIMIFGTSGVRTAYFGRTAENVASAGRLGSWARGSNSASAPFRGIGVQESNSMRYECREGSFLLTSYDAFTPDFGSFAGFVGVISKATAGFIVDTGTVARYPAWDITSRSGAPISFPSSSPTIEADWFTTGVTSQWVSLVSGFIAYEWNLNKRSWLAGARTELLSKMTDAKIKSAYSDALAELITEIPANGMVTDGIRFTFGYSGGVVSIAPGGRAGGWKDYRAIWSPFHAIQQFAPPDPVNGYPDPYTNTDMNTTAPVTMFAATDCEVLTDGDGWSVVPGFHVTATTTAVEYGAGADGTLAIDGPFFSPGAVPYGSCILAMTQKIPLSGIVACLFPGSKPIAADWSTLPTLDLSSRVEKEIMSQSGNLAPFAVPAVDQANETVVSARLTTAVADIAGEQTRLLAVLPYLTPFTAFVVEASVKLDQKVVDGA